MTDRRVVVDHRGRRRARRGHLRASFAGEPDTDLVLSDVSAPSLEATVAGLPDGDGSVETVLADVSDFAQVEAVVARAVERFGRLDVLISNAGVLSPNGRIHNLATEDWERAFRINVLGAVNGIQAAVGGHAPAGVGLDRADRVGLRAHGVVARRALLRHEGGGHPARQGRRRRVRPRRHPGELRVPGHVPLGDPRRPPARGARRDRGAPPARARRGRRPRRAPTPTWPSDASRWTTGSALVVDGGYSAP